MNINNMELSTETSGLMGVSIPVSMITSPSVSTFLPEEEASICPLLPATPSPPPMDFIHPLTPSTGNDNENLTELTGDDARAETSSSSGSSGIGMDIPIAGTTTLYNNKNVYQNLGHNGETIQENGTKQYANLNIQITKDTPGFVHWNWPLIRKCTFCFFLAGVMAMVGIVIAMIASLPSVCNPKTAWYKGGVFYEIFPASFQDSNSDGLGDLLGLANRVGYLNALGISVVRLNSIFPSKNYPDHFQNVTTLMEIDEVLGGTKELTIVIEKLRARNMSLVLDLPIYPLVKELHITSGAWNDTNDDDPENSTSVDFNVVNRVSIKRAIEADDDVILSAMKLWISYGIQGFYVKGLENFHDDPYLLENVRRWKYLLGFERILMVSNNFVKKLDDKFAREVLKNIDMVDVLLDVSTGSKYVAEQIKSTIEGPLTPGYGPYIQWSLGGVTERRLSTEMSANTTLAATFMELMLPGSPSIFYGDEISLQESHDPFGEHGDTKHLHHLSAMAWNAVPQFTNREQLPWLPRGASVSFHHLAYITELIKLRKDSPTIYRNVIRKNNQADPNTSVRNSRNDLLIVERWYPRRNTFVSISNFGTKKITLDLSALWYSGEVVAGKSKCGRILFSEFVIGPIETIVIRLDK